MLAMPSLNANLQVIEEELERVRSLITTDQNVITIGKSCVESLREYIAYLASDDNLAEMTKYLVKFTELERALVSKIGVRDTLKSIAYSVKTAQEWQAIGEAAANGSAGTYWETDEQARTRSYRRKELNHSVKLSLLPDDTPEMGTDFLESLTSKMSVTSTFALMYIGDLLVETGSAWVDLNDVAKKIGRNPARKEDYAHCRRDVFDYITFGERAVVIGERSIAYIDKPTKRTISTNIHSSLWKITDTQRPDQLSLLNDPIYGDTPVAVRLSLSSQWQDLMQHPDTRQFLPFGELLGSIPGKKPSGAYARVMGLMLLNFWRRKSLEALNGTCYQTRRELLMTYQPEVALPQEVLDGKNPGRLIESYYDALSILRDLGIVAATGDAVPHKDRREGLKEQGWDKQFLAAVPSIHPGPIILPALEDTAMNKYIGKPKPLGEKRGRKTKPLLISS